MTWPAAAVWLLILIAAISRGPLIIYMFSTTVVFGAMTLLPSGLTGGLNLPPQTVCAAILIAKVFVSAENRKLGLALAQDVRKLGLLAIFAAYAVLTSFLFPRLFAGDVMLFSLNAAASESPLVPTSANFTQAVYLLISLGTCFALAVGGRSPVIMRHYMRSVLLAGILLVVSGVIDSALANAGQSALLTPFHNASYATLEDVSISGQKRIIGFMPEASVFGEMCCLALSFLLFNFSVFEASLKKRILPLTIVGLFIVTFFSTASTGYVGLIVICLVQIARIICRLLFFKVRGMSPARKMFFVSASIVTVIIGCSFVSAAQLAHYGDLLNVLLFQKTSSSSYIERSSWTAAGVAAFFTTHGVGVGVGSIRTSNWFVNITASTGIVGVLLLILFLLNMLSPFRSFADKQTQSFATGLKLCLIPAAAMIALSGTTPDPGVWITSIFGLLYSLRLQPLRVVRPRPREAQPVAPMPSLAKEGLQT